jgi:nickel/cobalt transporter (NiCoT) family protein
MGLLPRWIVAIPNKSHRNGTWRVAGGLGLLLLALNLTAWVWAWLVWRTQAIALGTALLAYTLGLRHAVDADHIAAIDNVTRKLVQEGRRPVTVGFFFALGHSTVVVLAAAAVAIAAATLRPHFELASRLGAALGASISAVFLLTIAAANALIVRSVWSKWRQVRRGGSFAEEDLNALLGQRGFAVRLYGPLVRLVRQSWHMYPLGFLFGLSFDTASEVALLGISVSAVHSAHSVAALMVFPALFAAGMSLLDSADGILMVRAYDWAFVKPTRKLLYNLVMTGLTVVVAVVIGSVEALGLLRNGWHATGSLWDWVDKVNANLSAAGFGIIAAFVVTWIAAVSFYRRAPTGN